MEVGMNSRALWDLLNDSMLRKAAIFGVFAGLIGISNVNAQTKGTLLKTYSFSASQFELDAIHHRMYATVPSTNSVAIFNTQDLSMVTSLFVGSNPFGLGLSEDGSRLYVGNRGSTASAVTALDTQSLAVVGNYSLPVASVDIAVGKSNLVYASPSGAATMHGIMVLNGLTGQFLGEFGQGTAYSGGLLETTPDRQVLFEQELGSSPSDVHKFILSGNSGSLAFSQETGDNGQDLAVSHNGQFFAAPNGAPYDIKLFRVSDGAVLGTLNVGAYPREVAFSPDDLYAYADHTAGQIDVFWTDTFLSTGAIPISGEATELMVDESGKYLFASVGNEIRIYATGVPEPASMLLGIIGVAGLFVMMKQRRARATARGVLLGSAPAH
jgi:DNA-binding beta-propeller fold protein YncE